MDEETTRAPHRPLKLLEDDVREKLLDSLRRGTTIVSAAAIAGISETTYYRWLERGREAEETLAETGELDPYETPFRKFREAVTRAHAQGEDYATGVLRKLIEGGYVVKTRTKRFRDPASGQVVEEVEEDVAEPDGRMLQFYLERRHRRPDGWGKTESLELSGPEGGPVSVSGGGTDLVALADQIRRHADQREAEEAERSGEVASGGGGGS